MGGGKPPLKYPKGNTLMLVIVNISPEDAPKIGPNQYEVRVNDVVLAEFEHHRSPNNAAQCFRDAASAIERAQEDRVERLTNKLVSLTEDGGISFNY
jgi:hypothetical protein